MVFAVVAVVVTPLIFPTELGTIGSQLLKAGPVTSCSRSGPRSNVQCHLATAVKPGRMKIRISGFFIFFFWHLWAILPTFPTPAQTSVPLIFRGGNVADDTLLCNRLCTRHFRVCTRPLHTALSTFAPESLVLGTDNSEFAREKRRRFQRGKADTLCKTHMKFQCFLGGATGLPLTVSNHLLI